MVKRGQLISGLNQLKADTGIPVGSLRSALKRLKSTSEITVQPTNRYSIITVCKYNDYQILGNEDNKQMTSKMTNKQHTKRQTDDTPGDKQNNSVTTRKYSDYQVLENEDDKPGDRQTTNKRQTNNTPDDNKQEVKNNTKEYTLESLRSLESLDNNKSLRAIAISQKKPAKRPTLTDDEFLTALKQNPAYKGVDIDRELGKMNAWLLTPSGTRRQKTRRFIVNWLNKIDRPLTIQTVDKPSPAEVEKQIQKNIEAFNKREEAKSGRGI